VSFESERTIKVMFSELESVMKKLTLEITANLIEATPVDTGWARANWIPKIGGPNNSLSGSRVNAEAGNIDSQQQQAGIAAVATSYKVINGPIYISNIVPYIINLNNGSSTKAPPGFVDIEIFKAIRVLRIKQAPTKTLV